MRKLFFLLIMPILWSCSSNYTDWDLEGLKGKVKQYEERSSKAIEKFGEWALNENDMSIKIVRFNENGRTKEWVMYDKNGGELDKEILIYEGDKLIGSEYFAKKLKVGTLEIEQDGNKIVYRSRRTIPIYEERIIKDKRITRVITDDYGDGTFDTLNNEYSEKGLLRTSSISSYENLEFDSKGNWTKRMITSKERPEDRYVEQRVYEYF
ncbi:MAG: hypothetical protein LBH34_00860 [Prevotellaceae bacterium]|jgi:hypothetical protein|nr:hypothetical protein [Prevotellaceae bacterium]